MLTSNTVVFYNGESARITMHCNVETFLLRLRVYLHLAFHAEPSVTLLYVVLGSLWVREGVGG